MPRLRPLLVPAVLLPLVLTGCSGLPDLTSHQRHGTAATPEALALAWSTPATQPDWLPADAARIRWVAVTTGGADQAPAALRAVSDADLPESCEPLESASGAAVSAGWAPESTSAEVLRCGNWAVTAVADGWYGWTPVDSPAAG